MFYGHCWRSRTPTHWHDWTDFTACVDFSAAKDGALIVAAGAGVTAGAAYYRERLDV